MPMPEQRDPSLPARLELHVSKTRTLGLLGLTCIMVGGSWFCTTLPSLEARIAGWAGICFFSLGFIAVPRQLRRTGPQVIIDERGIGDLRSKFALIEWADVAALSIGSIHGQKFLCVQVVDPEKYLSRLSASGRAGAKANLSLGFPEIALTFSGLTQTADEVLRFIAEHYPPRGTNAGNSVSSANQ